MNDLKIAIETKNVEAFKEKIYSPLVFYTPEFVEYMLKFAVEHVCLEETAYILQHNIVSEYIKTKYMHTACNMNSLVFLQLFGENSMLKSGDGNSLLITAVSSGSIDCTKWILDNMKNIDFSRVIHIACEKNNGPIVKLLINRFIEVPKNIKSIEILTSIGKSGSIEIYNLMKPYLNADLDYLLKAAADNKHIEFIKYLLTKENITSCRYISTIFIKHKESELLEFTKDIWPLQKFRMTLMWQACAHEYRTIIDYILEQPDFSFGVLPLNVECLKTIYVVKRLLQDHRISPLKIADVFIAQKPINGFTGDSYLIMDELMSIPEVFWTYASSIQKRHWYSWQMRKQSQLHAELFLSRNAFASMIAPAPTPAVSDGFSPSNSQPNM